MIYCLYYKVIKYDRIMESNQEHYNSQDPNDPFFSNKIIIEEETQILMEESEGIFDKNEY
jgi:hypothetical protein